MVVQLRPAEIFFLIRFGLTPSRVSVLETIEAVERKSDSYTDAMIAAQFMGTRETSELFAQIVGIHIE